MEILSRDSEILRRRAFAIISHPDAGKTTLTEKLIFHGGVIHQAGEVKGKSGTKAATSDWMKLEQEKGISITSSVIQFDYHGLRMNLLDTPGHKDFSEDTYRTLMAADSAVMLIDVAKGVEERTRKLYEVCSYRKMPIFTFINKCDREGKSPLELIDEIETTLKMKCYPLTWPMGLGGLFAGLYNRLNQTVILFNGKDNQRSIEIPVSGLKDPRFKEWIHRDLLDGFLEEIELLDATLEPFSVEKYLAGELSPTTFGSAKMNFAVDLFLDFFSKWAPGPQKRLAGSAEVKPLDKDFSGFVFKIQANMDPKHRDRIAFIRICSGHFERGMKVMHHRLGRELRLAHSSQFVAQERETTDNAYAGDIVGVSDTGNFQIGDTVTVGKKLRFDDIPKFPPEMFCQLNVRDALKRQKLQKAVKELSEEGTIQIFIDPIVGPQDPVIGVVGELQFTVLTYRLKDEYGLDVQLQRLPYTVARWPRHLDMTPAKDVKGVRIIFRDLNDQPVVLLNQEWDLRWLEKENKDLTFGTPFAARTIAL